MGKKRKCIYRYRGQQGWPWSKTISLRVKFCAGISNYYLYISSLVFACLRFNGDHATCTQMKIENPFSVAFLDVPNQSTKQGSRFAGDIRRSLPARSTPSKPNGRTDENHSADSHDCSLGCKDRSHTVLRNPTGLEVADGESTTGA
ncbi:hypothetical protein CLAIMM_10374 isoform 2, partial [Cladophialophora immunda]